MEVQISHETFDDLMQEHGDTLEEKIVSRIRRSSD